MQNKELGVQKELNGHWIISQGSQANKGRIHSSDGIWGEGFGLGDGCLGEMILHPSPLMPTFSHAPSLPT